VARAGIINKIHKHGIVSTQFCPKADDSVLHASIRPSGLDVGLPFRNLRFRHTWSGKARNLANSKHTADAERLPWRAAGQGLNADLIAQPSSGWFQQG
jgi:hypothetical protein